MTKTIKILFFSSLLFACEPRQVSQPKQFFEHSLRRDATPREAVGIVRLDNGCTGFFVENGSPRNVLVSARHCFSEANSNWCQEEAHFKTWDGRAGSCSEVLFESGESDIVIFAEDHEKYGSETLALFTLSPEPLKPGEALAMIGYPADIFRAGTLTYTSYCNAQSMERPNPYLPETLWTDPAVQHNCSTYGGNSGGPIVREGTKAVVGLPITYMPGYYELISKKDRDLAAYLASANGFLRRFAGRLEPIRLVGSIAREPDIVGVELTPVEEDYRVYCESQPQAVDVLALKKALGTTSCRNLSFTLSSVSELHLADSGLQNLEFLQRPIFGQGQVKAIYAAGNPIASLERVGSLGSLRLLDISRTGVTHLKGLEGSKLLLLYADSLGITSLDTFLGGANLPVINRIYLRSNRISDAAPLAGYSSLRVLSLADQQGADKAGLLGSLAGFTQLKLLDLYGLIDHSSQCPLADSSVCSF